MSGEGHLQNCPANIGDRRPWFERYQEQLHAARAFLKEKGLHAERVSMTALVPSWRVGGYLGSFDNHELVDLAKSYGFEGSLDA